MRNTNDFPKEIKLKNTTLYYEKTDWVNVDGKSYKIGVYIVHLPSFSTLSGGVYKQRLRLTEKKINLLIKEGKSLNYVRDYLTAPMKGLRPVEEGWYQVFSRPREWRRNRFTNKALPMINKIDADAMEWIEDEEDFETYL